MASASPAVATNPPRTRLILHALSFVLGFSLLFSLAGFSFGVVGRLVDDYRPIINLVAGVALAVFGLHLTGLFRELAFRLAGPAREGRLDWARRAIAAASARLAGALYRQGQIEFRTGRSGYRSSFAVGLAFALGWTPCVGFILGGILTAAYNSESVATAYLLLLSYSLGLGVPFLILAAFTERLQGPLTALSRRSNAIAIASGILLMVFGLFIAFDLVALLSRYLADRSLTTNSLWPATRRSTWAGWRRHLSPGYSRSSPPASSRWRPSIWPIWPDRFRPIKRLRETSCCRIQDRRPTQSRKALKRPPTCPAIRTGDWPSTVSRSTKLIVSS